MPHFYEDDVGNAASEYLEELKSAHGDNCIRLIQSQGSGDSVQLLKIWAHTLLSFQHTIHRTHVLNTMLSLIEV